MSEQFIQELEATLSLALSPDNAAIKQATTQLTHLYKDDSILPSMVQILLSTSNTGLQQLTAVELNKLIPKNWSKLNPDLKQQIRLSTLQFSLQHDSKKIRHLTSRVIASIADIDIPLNEWPDLLQSLVTSSQDPTLQVKESSLYTINCILEKYPIEWLEHSQDFLNLFALILNDTNSTPELQVTSITSLETISNYASEDDEVLKNLQNLFNELIPSMFQALKNSIYYQDLDQTKTMFNSWNELAVSELKLIIPIFVEFYEFLIETSLNSSLDEEIRCFAIKLIIIMVSCYKSKTSQLKLGPKLSQLALKLACEVDENVEDELDNEEDELNENEEDSPNSLGLRLLNMLSVDLPPNQVCQPVFELLPSMLQSTNEFERRGSLLAVGFIVEGAPDYISTQLPKVIQALMTGLQDSSIIVQAATLRVLSLISEELKDVVAEYHAELLPPIISIIDSTNKIMVYKYATKALDILIEYMSYESIKLYMEPLMNKLFQMMDSAQSSSLKSTIVSAIGSVAYASGKSFTPFFSNSIQFLERFIANMDNIEGMTENDIELRAQTFENISSMARAVGSEAFSPYAQPLISASYQAIHSTNGRLRESGFAFISNMAKVYGEQFTPFLEKIIPEIFVCLNQDEIATNFEDVEDFDNLDEEELLNNQFNVHTGITVEKEVALVALSELAIGTKKGFTPFVEQTMSTLATQIDESIIRESALATMWKVVQSMYNSYGIESSIVLNLIQTVSKITVAILPDEFDMIMVNTCLDCLSENIKLMGKVAILPNLEDSTNLETLVSQLQLLFKNEHLSQLQDLEDEFNDDDDQDTSEMDVVIYDMSLEVLVSLSSAFGPEFHTIFTPFKDLIFNQVNTKSKNKRVSTLGSLAEIANGMKSNNPYLSQFLEIFVTKLQSDKSSEVRGNAAYGVGIIIENSTDDMKLENAYPTILNALSKLLNKADKESLKTEDGDDETHDVINRTFANACGCVSRMILKHSDSVPLNIIIPVLFDHLPLVTGFEENEPIFEVIYKLFQMENPIILNSVPKVVDIFEFVFIKELEKQKLIEESTLGREENIERFNQFINDESKSKAVEFLKYLNEKFNGIVATKEVLKNVIA
ncbi:hypothetical protein CANARDRAFT_27731 [[Candida] arabinofermentans NRRL YB-2248]|uniref:Importin N-terminal domain-containing protein n=1 Tax=[Candida] arabinofermentans NRRL YB-2248 TaxID=983967 RepID=A0A1E4T461_9ASCO|nr:hypothetical protein CANARDRAFT_27731 [[Candida] arabinofermentans NRRL YB-2248]